MGDRHRAGVPSQRISWHADQSFAPPAAAAREYRETLAIEKAMKEKRFDTKDWATKQVAEHDASMKQAVAAEVEPA